MGSPDAFLCFAVSLRCLFHVRNSVIDPRTGQITLRHLSNTAPTTTSAKTAIESTRSISLDTSL